MEVCATPGTGGQIKLHDSCRIVYLGGQNFNQKE